MRTLVPEKVVLPLYEKTISAGWPLSTQKYDERAGHVP